MDLAPSTPTPLPGGGCESFEPGSSMKLRAPAEAGQVLCGRPSSSLPRQQQQQQQHLRQLPCTSSPSAPARAR
jgi:hypothetical protein